MAPAASAAAAPAAATEPAGGFGAALSRILSRELHAAPSAGPVLSKRRTAAAKAAAAALVDAADARARANAKRAAAGAVNRAPTALSADAERALRRVATRGVVALFNAVTTHQRGVERAMEEPTRGALRTVRAKQASFLELLQSKTRAATTGAGGIGGGTGSGVARPGVSWLKDEFAEASGTAKGARAAAAADAAVAEDGGILGAEAF